MVDENRSDDGAQAKTVEELLLAAVGWAALTADAIDDLADELALRVGADRAKMRAAVRDTLDSWRKGLDKSAARRTELSERLVARLGLCRREELTELTLTVAQLDHRLRLLERGTGE
jgi:polyhydroxyalkanoate synthesis regulator phasin